jgi:hypothetical protein
MYSPELSSDDASSTMRRLGLGSGLEDERPSWFQKMMPTISLAAIWPLRCHLDLVEEEHRLGRPFAAMRRCVLRAERRSELSFKVNQGATRVLPTNHKSHATWLWSLFSRILSRSTLHLLVVHADVLHRKISNSHTVWSDKHPVVGSTGKVARALHPADDASQRGSDRR